jgi:hypothetical protein
MVEEGIRSGQPWPLGHPVLNSHELNLGDGDWGRERMKQRLWED